MCYIISPITGPYGSVASTPPSPPLGLGLDPLTGPYFLVGTLPGGVRPISESLNGPFFLNLRGPQLGVGG